MSDSRSEAGAENSETTAEKKPEVQKPLTEKELENKELRDKEREAYRRYAFIDAALRIAINRVDRGSMQERPVEDVVLEGGEGLPWKMDPGWLNLQFKDDKGKTKDEIYKLFLDEKGHISSPNQSIEGQRAKMEAYRVTGQHKLVLSFPNVKSPGDYNLDRVEKIVNEAVKAGVAIRIGDAMLMERLSDPRFYDNIANRLTGKPGQVDRIFQQIAISQQNLANNKELNRRLEAVGHAHHSDKLQTRTTEVKAAATDIVKGMNVEKLPQQVRALETAVDKTKETLSDIKTLLAKGSPSTDIAQKYQVELEKLEKEIKGVKAVFNKDHIDKPGVADAVKKLEGLEQTVVAMKKSTRIEATDPEARLKEKLDELGKSKAELLEAKTAVEKAADDKANPDGLAKAMANFREKVKEVRNDVETIASDCKKADYREETKSGPIVEEAATQTTKAIEAVKAKVGEEVFKANEKEIKNADVGIQYASKEVVVLNDPIAATTKRLDVIAALDKAASDPKDMKESILAEQRLLHTAIERVTQQAKNEKGADVGDLAGKYNKLVKQHEELTKLAAAKGLADDQEFKVGMKGTREQAMEMRGIIERKQEAVNGRSLKK